MIKKLTPLEKMLALSILFNMLLLAVRFYFMRELTYGFYVWNTFLAVLPLFFSRMLAKVEKCNLKAIVLIGCWLSFFPNAPYMVTDLFHYVDNPPVPQWYDLLIVVLAAWNGLLLGIVSLMQVEHFLMRHLKRTWVQVIVVASCALCGYGVYIGRYLRYNTWDTLTNPGRLLADIARSVLRPHQHTMTWAFTILFGLMFGIVYFTLKELREKRVSVEER
ncbi:Uncharacterized membrane protein [Filimonas lacunae]|uniref:Uncharacterized membrane protein n=1 Tax=Filimonas lacunae TaxID=477680 RepID=A0A173MBC2_9BACT|nr:DUF1361 domain-containing protein [Filimonas lacunae]BAV04826.1 membrane protein [Filimonas lacunae]SIT34702.1 Uncharacterized membrane protein [Filimonas lacunae]